MSLRVPLIDFGLRDYGVPPTVWGGDPECAHEWGELGRAHHPGQVEQSKWKKAEAAGKGGNAGSGRFCLHCDAWLGCLGLEPDVDLYVAHIVEVFEEVRRVLRRDGSLWLNLGDSYATKPGWGRGGGSTLDGRKQGKEGGARVDRSKQPGIKPKDMYGIPWRCAFALQQAGWYLRSDVVWHKVNALPSSVKDRPTCAHEYLFLLTKSQRYYYDYIAVQEPLAEVSVKRMLQPTFDLQTGGEKDYANGINPNRSARKTLENLKANLLDAEGNPTGGRRKRTVWSIPTRPFSAKYLGIDDVDHFASFPPALVMPCVLSGTSQVGCCPDCGAPWKRIVVSDSIAEAIEVSEDRKPLASAYQSRHRTSIPGGQSLVAYEHYTAGWQPSCGCASGLKPDDLEMIETPTGERVGDDPTLITGRAGWNRPRGESEGRRTITRWEQRDLAEQLKASPHREAMAQEAGPAFAHYIRTDRSGARPVPDSLLQCWEARGWIERRPVPVAEIPEPVPCTVLDPFSGSGTTGEVATTQGRHYIGIDVNAGYIRIAEARIQFAREAAKSPKKKPGSKRKPAKTLALSDADIVLQMPLFDDELAA